MNARFAEQLKSKNQEKLMLDGIDDAIEQIEFDPISEKKAIADLGNLRMAAMWVALSTVKIVSETDADDEDALLPNEVLDGLTLDALDAEDDDDDVDGLVRATLSAHIADAFSFLGVDDDVVEDLFSSDFDVADAAIESACDTVLDNLPDDDALDELYDQFAYGYEEDEEGEESEFDGMMFDGKKKPKKPVKKVPTVGKNFRKKVGTSTITYTGKKVIRNGKVKIVGHRIRGKVVLSAEQKAALNKARMKAHTGSARQKRLRSIEKGIKKGLYSKSMKTNKAILRMTRGAAGKKVD